MALSRRPQKCLCKLSGLITETDWRKWRAEDFLPYLNVVFETFGPERTYVGSDWPVCLLAGSYRQVKQLIETYVSKVSINQKKLFSGSMQCGFMA